MQESILGLAGRWVAPAGALIGLDWKMIVALLTSLVAKENSIATLGVLYGVGDEGLRSVLPQVMSQASALAFLVVLMLFVPCAATLAAMHHEMRSRGWFAASFLTMLAISFLGGLVAYHLALLLHL